MNLKDILDEQLNLGNAQERISQLSNGVNNFYKKVLANPILAQSLGKDMTELGKLSLEAKKELQELLKQQQAQNFKEAEKQQQQQQQPLTNNSQIQKGAVMANGQKNLSTVKYNTPTKANV